MANQLFSDPAAFRHLHAGPLSALIAKYAVGLSEHGYAYATAREHIRLIAKLSDWLERRQLGADQLNGPAISQFLQYRRRRGRVPRSNLAILQAFLKGLREAGLLPAITPQITEREQQRIEHDFAHYLAQERGLAPATLNNYLPTVQRFLCERFGSGPLALTELRAQDVSRFILRHARTVSPARAQLMVTALRSFLRFLLQRGDIATNLAASVPAVANWHLSHLPKYLLAAQVEQLLQSCDRDSPTGQRNYAILLLLARLGLRAGEVVAMTLDDLHWEAGELTVRGKGARWDRLPIPQDVGEALATYLRQGRPRCATRRVFVNTRAPLRGFANSVAVCSIVQRGLKRAGLDPALKGAHLLRHSLATRMLRQGASLAQIGEILRHRLPNTTQIYAKIDQATLSALAQPWPGGAQ